MLDCNDDDKFESAEITPLWTYRKTIDTEPLVQMKRHWAMLRRGGDVPARSDIDPRAISGALECGFVAERTQPGMVRFRLAGLALCDLMGMEVRGMPIKSLVAPASRAEFSARLDHVFDAPEMHELAMISDNGTDAPLTAKMLILPLRGTSGEIDRAIGCIVTDGAIGLSPRRFRVVQTVATSLVTGHQDKQVFQTEIERFARGHITARPFGEVAPRPTGAAHLRVVK